MSTEEIQVQEMRVTDISTSHKVSRIRKFLSKNLKDLINFSEQLAITNCKAQFVSNKAKGRISKLLCQENEARKIFRKTKFFYPLIRKRRCEYQGVRNICFTKNWRALFS